MGLIKSDPSHSCLDKVSFVNDAHLYSWIDSLRLSSSTSVVNMSLSWRSLSGWVASLRVLSCGNHSQLKKLTECTLHSVSHYHWWRQQEAAETFGISKKIFGWWFPQENPECLSVDIRMVIHLLWHKRSPLHISGCDVYAVRWCYWLLLWSLHVCVRHSRCVHIS